MGGTRLEGGGPDVKFLPGSVLHQNPMTLGSR